MLFQSAAGAVLAVLSVLLTAQVPAPEPSLPVIGRTHSKGFCTTVRDGIAPAVLGLMQNDDLIASSHAALLKAGHDASLKPNKGFAPAAVELDRIYLSRVADSRAHHLGPTRRRCRDPASPHRSSRADPHPGRRRRRDRLPWRRRVTRTRNELATVGGSGEARTRVFAHFCANTPTRWTSSL
jgi:hypothetical protein